MADILVIYQNDAAFARDFILKKSDNSIYDLTGHTVKFKAIAVYGGVAKINAAAVIVSPPSDGRVRYTFVAADSNTVEKYHAEIEVTEIASGKILSFRVATLEVRPSQ